MIEVPQHKIDLAYDRWCHHFGRNEYFTFWKFIGRKPNYHTSWPFYELHDHEIVRLEMLLGPHYVAIIKAHKARRHGKLGKG